MDGSGHPTSRPYVSINGAAPEMAPASASITLRNSGTIPAAYRVSTANLSAIGPGSLDDVLVANVRSARGEVRYRGNLSGLTFTDPDLEPGHVGVFDLRISWPSTSNDDAYQGQSLAFSLRADAAPAEG